MADSPLHSHERHIHHPVRHHTHDGTDGLGRSVACSQQGLRGQVCIALGRLDLGVPKELLDLIEATPGVDQ